MLDDDENICPECGKPLIPDIENQDLCEICEAKLHEQYGHTIH